MKTTKRVVPETDTLLLHRRMYERRMKRLRQRGGLTEQQLADEANDPTLFRRGEDTDTDSAVADKP